MKRAILSIIVTALLFTACPVAIAETLEPEKAFVIDGELDQWYRNDLWAEEANCYFYYRSLEDRTLALYCFDSHSLEDLNYDYFPAEGLAIDIYSAYDENYAYFYVYVANDQISSKEGIDFYVDTDTANWNKHFYLGETEYDVAETHFTMMAGDLSITDVEDVPKYSLANQKETTMGEYFNNPENVKGFHKTDGEGNIIGYGCEARFPLVYNISSTYEEYTDYYYNIAIRNPRRAPDATTPDYFIITGYRWWLDYSTGKTVSLDLDNNPFLNKPDPDKIAAEMVNAQLKEIPSPDEIQDWQGYLLEEARAYYEQLTDTQKAWVSQELLDNLAACEQTVYDLNHPDGDINEDGTTDATDALWVLLNAVSKQTLTHRQECAAKVSADNEIDAKDALLILQYAVGVIDGFPLRELI